MRKVLCYPASRTRLSHLADDNASLAQRWFFLAQASHPQSLYW